MEFFINGGFPNFFQDQKGGWIDICSLEKQLRTILPFPQLVHSVTHQSETEST